MFKMIIWSFDNVLKYIKVFVNLQIPLEGCLLLHSLGGSFCHFRHVYGKLSGASFKIKRTDESSSIDRNRAEGLKHPTF